MDRRKFIAGGSAIAASAFASAAKARRGSSQCPKAPVSHNLERITPALADLNGGRQPNILMVFTDQERYYGNLPPTLKRPNFDRLLMNSVTFDHAFCAYPLCSPSRSAVFSGLYPHQTGVTENMMWPTAKNSLDMNAPHIGSVLASAGYRIGYKGKWDISRGPRYYLVDASDRGRAGPYGYEGHCGDVADQEYAYIADEQVVEESCAWIKDQDKNSPWFLCCSIIDPHDIVHPRLKPDDSIRPDVVLPESLYDDLAGKPSRQQNLRSNKTIELIEWFKRNDKSFSDYDERDWRLFLSFYYDLIEGTDRHLGKLFAVLEDADMLDNTVIVYHSDHGEMGGAHGFHGKKQGYEEAIHIPLHFHHPALEKKSVDSFVSNVSIGPTLAALAGARWPGKTAGKDLSGWINDKGAVRDDWVVSEVETNQDYIVHRDISADRFLRTDKWKYSRSLLRPQEGQLYDLENDPAEMNNLFHDQAHGSLKKELDDRLKAWQKETDDPHPFPV